MPLGNIRIEMESHQCAALHDSLNKWQTNEIITKFCIVFFLSSFSLSSIQSIIIFQFNRNRILFFIDFIFFVILYCIWRGRIGNGRSEWWDHSPKCSLRVKLFMQYVQRCGDSLVCCRTWFNRCSFLRCVHWWGVKYYGLKYLLEINCMNILVLPKFTLWMFWSKSHSDAESRQCAKECDL